MALVHHGKHPIEDGFFGGERSDLKVGLAIVAGILAIAAILAALAMVSTRFDIGPRMDPIAYVFLALVAVVLLVKFLVTLIGNEVQAGLCLLLCWALTLSSAFLVFRYFG
jgi:hypothetical protein